MIYIYTKNRLSYSYGSNILYYLCSELNAVGFPARLIGNDFHGTIYDTDVVVYDESELGNPLKAKQVVRYLLNIPWIKKGVKLRYSDCDYLVAHSMIIDSTIPQLYLMLDEKDLISKLRSSSKDNYGCFYFGKFTKKSIQRAVRANWDAMKCIPIQMKIIHKKQPRSHEETLRLLSRASLLISFDGFSSINYEASFLGTPVFVANDYMALREKRMNITVPGIYYSLEEIKNYCDAEREMAFEIYCTQLDKQREQIKSFANNVYNHFDKVKTDAMYLEKNKTIIERYNSSIIKGKDLYSIYSNYQVPILIRKLCKERAFFYIPEFVTTILTDFHIAKQFKQLIYKEK